jgi:hypothetical protein
MPDEPSYVTKARLAVEQRKLPNRPPDRLWGGPGVGAPCRVCDRPVEKDEMEFEIEFARDGGAPHFDGYHVHAQCFAAWELARIDGHSPG